MLTPYFLLETSTFSIYIHIKEAQVFNSNCSISNFDMREYSEKSNLKKENEVKQRSTKRDKLFSTM